MYHHYNNMQKPLWGGISNARNANNDNSISTKKKIKMKTKKKKRKKRKKKDLKGKKDFKKEMAKKEDYPETSIDPVSRQDLIAYSKNSSSSVELTHPVINLSDSIVDNNFQQDDIITVKVEKQLLTIENGKIKDDYEHDHRQNNTFENEEKRK